MGLVLFLNELGQTISGPVLIKYAPTHKIPGPVPPLARSSKRRSSLLKLCRLFYWSLLNKILDPNSIPLILSRIALFSRATENLLSRPSSFKTPSITFDHSWLPAKNRPMMVDHHQNTPNYHQILLVSSPLLICS